MIEVAADVGVADAAVVAVAEVVFVCVAVGDVTDDVLADVVDVRVLGSLDVKAGVSKKMMKSIHSIAAVLSIEANVQASAIEALFAKDRSSGTKDEITEVAFSENALDDAKTKAH